MSAQHTPGPWTVERWTDENEQPIWDDDTNDYLFCVCHSGTMCDATTVVNLAHEANAHLIAAAPAMADSIRDFLFALDRGYLGEIGQSAFIDSLRTELAKARGES